MKMLNLDSAVLQAVKPTVDHPISTQLVVKTLEYVRNFYGQTILVKLGGSSLMDWDLVATICKDLALIQSLGIPVVLVHGGGPAINEELTRRGIQWEFYQGQRITTAEMMEVIEMVLCGKVNSRIVRTLQANGAKAVGISGSDASLLLSKRAEEKLGHVGVIQSVNTSYLAMVLKSVSENEAGNIIPVIATVGVDEEGNSLNINADWAACRIAQALSIRKLIYLTDQDGILNERGQLISELNRTQLKELIQREVVKGGMLTKAKTVLDALNHRVNEVHVIQAKRPHSLIEELFTDQGVGTMCRA